MTRFASFRCSGPVGPVREICLAPPRMTAFVIVEADIDAGKVGDCWS